MAEHDAADCDAASAPVDPARRAALQALLAGAASLLGVSAASIAAQPTRLDPVRFLELSRRLTAMPIRSRSLAAEIQAAIAPFGSAGDLARLADLAERTPPDRLDQAVTDAGLRGPADLIVIAWYAGLAGPDTALRVITHTDALAWAATGYAKAPGTCDEAFGAWTRPPVIAPAREAGR